MPIHAPKQWGNKIPKTLLLLGARGPPLIHPGRDQPHSPHQTTYRSIHAISHNYAAKSPLVTMERPPQIHLQNCPCPSTMTTPSNTRVPRLLHSLLQTAPGSTQPFCHNTLSRQTDRPTDRWSRQETCTKSDYALMTESDTLKTLQLKKVDGLTE